eukprot:g48690.t1
MAGLGSVIEKALPPFYLNLLVLNKDEAVKRAVEKKTGSGPFGYGVVGKLGSAVANRLMTEDKMTAEIAKKLVDRIPAKTKDMGITLEVQTRFQKGCYLVLRARVVQIDPDVLIPKAKGEEFHAKFKTLLEALTFLGVQDAGARIEEKISQKVHDGLMTKICEILPEKLEQEAHVKVEVTAKDDAEQAGFFYDFLESLEATGVK